MYPWSEANLGGAQAGGHLRSAAEEGGSLWEDPGTAEGRGLGKITGKRSHDCVKSICDRGVHVLPSSSASLYATKYEMPNGLSSCTGLLYTLTRVSYFNYASGNRRPRAFHSARYRRSHPRARLRRRHGVQPILLWPDKAGISISIPFICLRPEPL
jgi:hypothetical protein